MHSETEFSIAEQDFIISVSESCMIHTVALSVKVMVKNDPEFLGIFVITEGDYLWNTLVEDPCSGEKYINLSPCIEYLKKKAKVFSRENLKMLSFNSLKKAYRYAEKHCKHPAVLREQDDFPKYPGT